MSLSRLGLHLSGAVLVALMLYGLVSQLRDGALSSCPAYDGLTDKAAHAALDCP